jgi:hypothetical protein
MIRSRVLWGVLLSCLVGLACASSALADGGQTIAGAPTVVYGQQKFGTLTNGAQTQDTWIRNTRNGGCCQ